MNLLTLENPVFCVYAIAAASMISKMMSQSWMTVFRMLKVNGGFRMPEDLRKTLSNPNPSPEQLLPNEYVERSRRIHSNDVENIPLFVASGLLYVTTAPGFTVSLVLFATYVVTRLLHFAIILGQGTHDARALAWTPGSLIIFWMSGSVVVHAMKGVLS
jgi:glutathione S-transferase